MSAKKQKTLPGADSEVGYGKPPKATQFKPGQSGNPAGRPRGRPSLDELLLEEAAKVVKLKAGDKIIHIDRDRALVRKLVELALQGNLRAMQLVIERLKQAQAAQLAKADPETPLTDDEIALLDMLQKSSEG